MLLPFYYQDLGCLVWTFLLRVGQLVSFFFFNDTATTEIYTLSLHDLFRSLAVALLADRMAGGDAVKHAWPRDERALSRSERFQFQIDLQKLGFDTGTPDGVLGHQSRAALRQYQKSKSLAADGFATATLLAMLDADAAKKN